MKLPLPFNRFVLAAGLVLIIGSTPGLAAEVAAGRLNRGPDTVTLDWHGGQGPFVVECSRDLSSWSAQGDPVANSSVTLPARGTRAAYRVIDLDPGDRHGAALGLIQTDQGEFGGLLGRHRLKTRLWLHTTNGAPHTAPSFTAADYFAKLIVVRQFIDNGRVRTWTGPLETLGTLAKPTATRMTLTWTEGADVGRRTCVLTLEFPYSHAAIRTKAPLASDPHYELKATYLAPQPEFDFDGTGLIISRTTLSETTALYQLDPANGSSPFPQPRQYTVAERGAEVRLHFLEGLPLLEGEPPFIWKTFILDRWLSPTTAGGGSLPSFTTDSWFSRTLKPGHHNFWETVLIEPALDPALSESTRAALLDANIRYIYTVKDLDIGIGSDEIRYVGFDHSLRAP